MAVWGQIVENTRVVQSPQHLISFFIQVEFMFL